MIEDYIEVGKHTFQYDRKFIREPREHLRATTQFIAICNMSIDTVELFKRTTAQAYDYILATSDYFSKWIKVVPINVLITLTELYL